MLCTNTAASKELTSFLLVRLLLQKSVRVRRHSHVDVSSNRNLSGGVCCLSDIGLVPSVFESEEKESAQLQHIIWMLCLPCGAVQDHLLQRISPILVGYAH